MITSESRRNAETRFDLCGIQVAIEGTSRANDGLDYVLPFAS
ncbi:MAG: hypothetical protein RIC81_00815 [Microcella pacifica]|nr:hypothetical protein [Microcella pacifica]